MLLRERDFRSDNRSENLRNFLWAFSAHRLLKRFSQRFVTYLQICWVDRTPINFEPDVDMQPCNVHVCSFQRGQAPATSCTHGQWPSCTFQREVGAYRHFLHPWPVTLVYIQHEAGRIKFLYPWPVTLVYISTWGRRLPPLPAPMASDTRVHSAWGRHDQLVAPMASDTRVHFSVRQEPVTSCIKWLVYISECATADAAAWSRTDLNKQILVNQSLRLSDRALHAGKCGRKSRR